MDDNARAFARNMFRLRVHESDGQAYEDLFVRIMQYRKRRFRPVKAQGSIGDRKNDGFDSKAGTYYQVYAPEDIRKTQGSALSKLKGDFKGLKAFWNGVYSVKKYYFVINDKYNGASPRLEKELARIKAKHKLDDAGPFLAKDLENELFQLKDDVIISLVGHVPEIDPGQFLFLSGFTYFIGAWIEFEKLGRRLVEPTVGPFRPIVGIQLIRTPRANGMLDSESDRLVTRLSSHRNRLVHGDTNELPPKEEIDSLVLLTERLRTIPIPEQ